MNKKGFAISVILYVIVFLIIAIFYILLGIVKARYSVNSDLKNSISTTFNSLEYIYGKLNNDNPVNLLVINPNGGKIVVDNKEITDPIEIVKYGDDIYVLPTPSRENTQLDAGTFSLSYNANGGYPTPEGTEISRIGTIVYSFNGWVSSGDCGTLNGNTYTFPETYSTSCTLTASWSNHEPQYSDSTVTLAGRIAKVGYDFLGWKSSVDGHLYNEGASYSLEQNTVMSADWNLNGYASQVQYSGLISSCNNVQCAIDKLNDMLK